LKDEPEASLENLQAFGHESEKLPISCVNRAPKFLVESKKAQGVP
jgi:hypothetical protein